MNITPQPKKQYPIEMHTAEHLLNQTMIRMFGCERSKNAHIERRKSKIDYILNSEPTEEQLNKIEEIMNEVIAMNMAVTDEFVSKENIPEGIDLSKLPSDVSESLRIVRIGDYDICACIGEHVSNTSEIGIFKMLNTDYENGRLRIRFKLIK